MNKPLRLTLTALVLSVTFAATAQGAASTPQLLPSSIGEIVRPPSTYVDARDLAQDTAETVTVKTFSESWATNRLVLLIFSATCTDYYISVTGTAAAPSGDVTDGTASARNPAALKFSQGDTFSLVASAACKVTMEYYLVVN